MFAAAAFCPHPPSIMPHVAGAAAVELDSLRKACDDAVSELRAFDEIVVVGCGPQTRACAAGSTGDLRGYGVIDGAPVTLGAANASPPRPDLPLSLTVGAWLLEGARCRGRARGQAVAESISPDDAATLGASLVAGPERVGLLVMGDGSARRTEDSPGYVHPEGAAFDRQAERLLGTADRAGLAALDPDLAREVLAVGRAPWQVAAAAAPASTAGRLLYADAPHDVGYVVAVWTPR